MRFAWVTCIEHVTHKRITTNTYVYQYQKFHYGISSSKYRYYKEYYKQSLALCYIISITAPSIFEHYYQFDGNLKPQCNANIREKRVHGFS
jgi:hypothetical protein